MCPFIIHVSHKPTALLLSIDSQLLNGMSRSSDGFFIISISMKINDLYHS